MSQQEARDSKLWIWTNIAVIVASAIFIVYPDARKIGFIAIPVFLLLGPLLFILSIRRVKSDGADLSMGALHEEVKRGKRLQLGALEIAASIAVLLAVVRGMVA